MAFKVRPSLCTTIRQSGFPSFLIRSFHISLRLQSSPKYAYAIAASFTAKDVRFRPERDVFNFNPYARILPRRADKQTRPASGQDAFFISRVSSSSDVAFGIADGVGGWVDSGVDPADFSHGICDYMAHAAYTYRPGMSEMGDMTPKNLMQRGYEDITEDVTVRAGGSTACVGIAKGDGGLDVANLGDSGYTLLRLNAVHWYSEPQTHAFNTPYQLSKIPRRMQKQSRVFGGYQLMDSPKDANVSQHALRHGDVLVFASDGVWDNLSTSDVLRVVSRLMVGGKAWEYTEKGITVSDRLGVYTKEEEKPEGIKALPTLQSFLAVGITGEAKAASVNRRLDGPFAREMQKYHPQEDWRGGKIDDICVVVAIVVEDGK